MSKELNEAAEAASYKWVADNPTEIMSHRQSFSAGFNGGANWQAQQDRWIPITKDIPEGIYDVYADKKRYTGAWLNAIGEWWCKGECLMPTHYMPIPQPPTV